MSSLRGLHVVLVAMLLMPLIRLHAGAGQRDVTIPFDAVNKNIFIKVSVGSSAPLWFLLDTGVKTAVIDLATATRLRLEFGEQVQVAGAGQNVILGRLLRQSTVSVIGLAHFSQPLPIAIPLDDLARSSGHEFAGILGFDFIRRFVVRIDYTGHTITLTDPSGYRYSGGGEILPITFNAAFHPIVQAQIVDGSRSPIEGRFVVDTGSGAALILNTPFVDREGFLQAGRTTVPWLAGRGFGGNVAGSVGRIRGLKIGRLSIEDPVAIFSRTTAGAFAATDTQGNIGAAILEKFTVILDYTRSRIILEPNASFADSMPYNRSGLALVGEGNDFRTFRVDAVADDSPASDSGIQVGDVIVAIDHRPAADRTLSDLRERLNAVSECRLVLKRGASRVEVTLRPRPLL